MPRPKRVPIPEPLKRQIRQRCGFGCVICGLPLYEYDHLDGPTDVNDPGRITLLCDRHHKERTNGLLPTPDVEKANVQPHNVRLGASAPYALNYSGSQCSIRMASNVHSSDLIDGARMCVLEVSGRCLVGFDYEDEHLLLTLDLRDADDHQLMLIDRSELVYWIDTWDIQLVGQRLTFRRDLGDIIFDATFSPPTEIVIHRADFFVSGNQLSSVTDDEVRLPGVVMRGNTFHNVGTAFSFGGAPVRPAANTRPSAPPVKRPPKIGRNESCFCGSGKKFKRCHGP
jgi:hypothetical protein